MALRDRRWGDGVTDYVIQKSFRHCESGGFTSCSMPFVSCPPYIIADIALAAGVALPEGYTAGTLESIKSITGWTGRNIHITRRQAEELAEIGESILELHRQGKIIPAISRRQSIEHLIHEVKK